MLFIALSIFWPTNKYFFCTIQIKFTIFFFYSVKCIRVILVPYFITKIFLEKNNLFLLKIVNCMFGLYLKNSVIIIFWRAEWPYPSSEIKRPILFIFFSMFFFAFIFSFCMYINQILNIYTYFVLRFFEKQFCRSLF